MNTVPFTHTKSEYNYGDKLKINKKLPQIIIPKNKIQMFVDWYNEDLRLQDTLPEAFNEGYLLIENDFVSKELDECTSYIKSLAKQLNTTYRTVQNRLESFVSAMDNVTLHFKFDNKNVSAQVYGNDGIIVSSISFTIGGEESNIVENKQLKVTTSWDDVLDQFNIYMVVLLCSSMWYICTTKNPTTYYYERKPESNYITDKEVRKVKHHKTLSTPVYDMNKVRRVKIEHLVNRRKGWTYDHAFQVCGHYRHYKDGKVVFINSYIKGKDKELQSQTITLNPKEIKIK